MKKLIVAFALLGLSTLVYASKYNIYAPTPLKTFIPAIYLGLQGGYAATNWDNLTGSLNRTQREVSGSNAAGGRFYIGYDYRKYIAVEGGYTQFFNDTKFGKYSSKNHKYSWALDASAKFKLPINDNFDIYTKVGFMRYDADLITKKNQNSLSVYNVLFAAGGSYNVNENLAFDLCWTRYNGVPQWDSAHHIPAADLYAIGVRYNFYLW